MSHTKVHNAFLMFERDNVFLDFYIDAATRLVDLNTGTMSPQYIGPKFLTGIHNVAQCPVLETAGMLSPLVINAVEKGSGPALELFRRRSPRPIAAANLCDSLCASGELSPATIERSIERLLHSGEV
ncbi:MAG: hypothetical protein VCB59_08895 [Gammaproteobacteria bacterium]